MHWLKLYKYPTNQSALLTFPYALPSTTRREMTEVCRWMDSPFDNRKDYAGQAEGVGGVGGLVPD